MIFESNSYHNYLSGMSSFNRRSLVRYQKRLFYCQRASETHYYLYERAEDVGRPARAAYCAEGRRLSLPSEEEIAKHKASLPVPPPLRRVSSLLVLPYDPNRITILIDDGDPSGEDSA